MQVAEEESAAAAAAGNSYTDSIIATATATSWPAAVSLMGTYQEILVILHITTGSSQYKYNAATNLISCISILFMNNMKYDWLRAIDYV